MRASIVSLTASLALATGCSLLEVGNGDSRIGIIAFVDSPLPIASVSHQLPEAGTSVDGCCGSSPVLEVPDTVTAGVAFDAIVRTFGNNGCWRAAGYRESTSGMTIEITPYDESGDDGGRVCTMAIVRLPRTARVSFANAGIGTIVVRGRVSSIGGSVVSADSMTTVSTTVVVR